MGLARRKFTKEVKLAAVAQLEAGSSLAEVARAFEISANFAAPLAEGIPARSGERVSRDGEAALE